MSIFSLLRSLFEQAACFSKEQNNTRPSRSRKKKKKKKKKGRGRREESRPTRHRQNENAEYSHPQHHEKRHSRSVRPSPGPTTRTSPSKRNPVEKPLPLLPTDTQTTTTSCHGRQVSHSPPSSRRRTPSTLPTAQPRLSAEPMHAATVYQVASSIDRFFSHIPYAICGLSALAQHGYTADLPTRVDIVCPTHTREAVRCWAIAKGLSRFSLDDDSHVDDETVPSATETPNPFLFGFLVPDNTVRLARIVFTEAFQNLYTIPITTTTTTITTETGHNNKNSKEKRLLRSRLLSLESIADDLAATYIRALSNGASTVTQNAIAQRLCWVLDRILRGDVSNAVATRRLSANLSQERFLLPFTLSFPRSVGLLKRIGVRIQRGEGEEEEEEQQDGDSSAEEERLLHSSYHYGETTVPINPWAS